MGQREDLWRLVRKEGDALTAFGVFPPPVAQRRRMPLDQNQGNAFFIPREVLAERIFDISLDYPLLSRWSVPLMAMRMPSWV